MCVRRWKSSDKSVSFCFPDPAMSHYSTEQAVTLATPSQVARCMMGMNPGSGTFLMLNVSVCTTAGKLLSLSSLVQTLHDVCRVTLDLLAVLLPTLLLVCRSPRNHTCTQSQFQTRLHQVRKRCQFCVQFRARGRGLVHGRSSVSQMCFSI